MESAGSFFRRGWGFATGLLGLVTFAVGALNFAIIEFGWPLAPFARPLIDLAQLLSEVLVDLNTRVDWLVPEWPAEFLTLIIFTLPFVARANALFAKGPMDSPLFKSYLLALTFYILIIPIPYLNLMCVFAIVSGFTLGLAVYPPVLIILRIAGSLKSLRHNNHFKLSAYMYGGVIGAATMLAANYYY